jgi:hypothetical protein
VVALSSSAVKLLVSLKWLREVRTRMPPQANLSSVSSSRDSGKPSSPSRRPTRSQSGPNGVLAFAGRVADRLVEM